MGQVFDPYEPDQTLLLPPSLRDWVPEGHLAHFVSGQGEATGIDTLITNFAGTCDTKTTIGFCGYDVRTFLACPDTSYLTEVASCSQTANDVVVSVSRTPADTDGDGIGDCTDNCRTVSSRR